MNINEPNPVAKRYLDRFASALSDLPEPARREMVQEIQSHIAEALRAGRDPAEVLEKLGPADRLAAAYRVEVLLHEKQSGGAEVKRVLGLMGALAGTSLLSFVVVLFLGALAFACLTSGLAMIVTGLLVPFLPEEALNTPFSLELTQFIMLVVGSVMIPLGLAALLGLWAYLKFLRRTVQRLMVRIRSSALAPSP